MIALNLKPSRRVLGQFAWIALLGLPLLGLVFTHWQFGHVAVLVLAGLAVVQLLLFLTWTDRLSWLLYAILSLVGFPIGFVISHLLMAVIYYLVVTPIGLALRLTRRDPLERRFDPARTSYWHQRSQRRAAASYFKLY